MTQWRVLVPIGIAIALWALGIVRLNVPGDFSLPVAASGPCRPTAAEVAATEVALASRPSTTPTPTISSPIVTTELVVLTGDRDVPRLIPSLVIRAPSTDQPAIDQLLSTTLSEIAPSSGEFVLVARQRPGTLRDYQPANSAAPVPFWEREEKNAYRALLQRLLINEDDVNDTDDIGLLGANPRILKDVLGINEPPLVGVAANGTVTLVIPQSPRALADNGENLASGWTVTSSGRDIFFLFEGRPEAKTTWDVRVCTDGLPIVSTSLITPTAGRRTPTAIPNISTADAPSATPPASNLVFENPNGARWLFPAGFEPTAIKVTTQAPLLSAFRMWLFTDRRQHVATGVTLLLPAVLLLGGVLLVLRFGRAHLDAKGSRARLAAASAAVVRLAVVAALYPLVLDVVKISRGWDQALYQGLGGNGLIPLTDQLPRGMMLAFPSLVVVALVSLGLLDLPRPRVKGAHQWAAEIGLLLIVILAIGICFGYLATVKAGREQARLVDPGVLIVGYMAFLATAIRLWKQPAGTLAPWRAMTVPAIAAVSILLCTLRGEVENRLEGNSFIESSILPLWVTSCVVVGFLLLARALMRDIPLRQGQVQRARSNQPAKNRWSRLKAIAVWVGIRVGVVLIILTIFGQWGWAIYNQENIWWRALVETDPLGNLAGLAEAQLAIRLHNYPIAFFVSVVELLFILSLIGFGAVLYMTGKPLSEDSLGASPDRLAENEQPTTLTEQGNDAARPREQSWKLQDEWVKWVLAGLFAAFVIGYGGQVLGLRAPVAFLFGLGLLRLTLSGKAEQDADRIDEENGNAKDGMPLIVAHRRELLHRALSRNNVEHQLSKLVKSFASGDLEPAKYHPKRSALSRKAESLVLGPTSTKGSAPALKLKSCDSLTELALTTGPENSWWENGRLAARLGSKLAIVPIAYFAYVFLTSGEWSLAAPFAISGLVTALTYEVAFWVVAAFSFGCLFPYLPGANGPVKGLVLAAIYVGANAAAALIGITGNSLWEVRSFQLLLFLMLLGAWMDLQSVEAVGFHRGDLIALYDLPNTTALVSQVLPLAAALAAVVAQLLSGQTQSATENLATGDAGTLILDFLKKF
jgi:hypothetical protein